jgi:hypothetical protein
VRNSPSMRRHLPPVLGALQREDLCPVFRAFTGHQDAARPLRQPSGPFFDATRNFQARAARLAQFDTSAVCPSPILHESTPAEMSNRSAFGAIFRAGSASDRSPATRKPIKASPP